MLQGNPRLWDGLRTIAHRSYDAPALARQVGLPHLSLAAVDGIARYRVLLDGHASCNPVVELFLLGLGVEPERAEPALAPLGVAALVDAGLVERDGSTLRATVTLLPFEDLWLVADRFDEHGVALDSRVPNTDLSTRLLANFVPRGPMGSALDLGTGTGIHALLAARSGASATGVDINPRALMFAAFNAGLNDLHAQWVTGDFFAVLDHQRFDLIVANPPFVISPDREDRHCFGGAPGDALSRRLTREVAARLDDGGLACVLCDFVHGTQEPWAEPLTEWIAGTGCDALLLRFSSTSAESYALAYHDQAAFPTSAAYERAVRAWLDSYREMGIEQIGSAVVLLRRRAAGTPWTRSFDLDGYPAGHVGGAVPGLFDAVERFAALDDDAMLAERLRPADGERLHQQLVREPSVFRPGDVRVVLPGSPLTGRISPGALPVLFGLDGEQDLGAVVGRVAAEYGFDETALREQVIPELRELALRGLLSSAG